MSRIRMTLAYDGSDFHGWQMQNNAVTVQETLQNALRELFGESIAVTGCSRTDAGVHAKEFVCHLDLPRPFPLHKLPLALNALLPESIGVFEAVSVPDDFHARFSCKGKKYRYRVYNSRLRDPFEEKRAYFYPCPLDADQMHRSAQSFVGEHDFSAFMASGSTIQDAVRRIYSFEVVRKGPLIEFAVVGNGFLYNMVRIMVGTLIWDSMGKLDRSIDRIIESRDRTLAGITVPPQGLYLEEVYYQSIV